MDKIECPKCGATGEDVTYENITFFRGPLAESYFYCQRCRTDLAVYFKATGIKALSHEV